MAFGGAGSEVDGLAFRALVQGRAALAAGLLPRRGMGLDLGAIGKGWAIDRAVEALRATGSREVSIPSRSRQMW